MASSSCKSDTSSKFAEIDKFLKANKKVLCIGLPCQIAGLKKYIGKTYDTLLTVDLICHGNCSDIYLKQHISKIENITKQKTEKVYFRNPNFETDKFHFTLENNKGIFWDKIVHSDDEYQIGYHNAITYRENCYSCRYATSSRCSDIMIGDYWLLGSKIPFNYSNKKVSLVYTCTNKGENFLSDTTNYLDIFERPIEESLESQGQLNHPSSKSKRHYIFVREYKKTHDFNRAMRKAVWLDIYCNKMGIRNQLNFIRKVINKVRKVVVRE